MSHCDCMPAIESLYDRVRERKKEHVCVRIRGMGGGDNESFTTKTI